jgi:hypothetical protein
MPWPGSPCASFESRTRMSQSLMLPVQRIMQGPAYQEKERRAATWNAAGCGSGLSESDMELVRDQSRSRPCGRKRKVNGCVLTGGAHGTFKAAAVVGSKTTNMVVKLWLDRARTRFRFLRPASRYTGSFCVFGPVLSSPAHAPSSLAMPQIENEIF